MVDTLHFFVGVRAWHQNPTYEDCLDLTINKTSTTLTTMTAAAMTDNLDPVSVTSTAGLPKRAAPRTA